MKVLRQGTRLRRIGRALEPGEYDAESIGLLAFRGEGGRLFIDQVERMMRTSEGTRRWFLRAIELLAADHDIQTLSIKGEARSEEHTSELQSLMRISYAVFCLKNKINIIKYT